MRYQDIQEGAARAVHQVVHYAPEILGTLSALLLGAQNLFSGNIQWVFVVGGVCSFFGGAVCSRIRDRDYGQEIADYRDKLDRLKSEKRLERDRAIRLETDNKQERDAIRTVVGRLAQELCNEMSWWDETTRVTIYGHIDDGPTPGFLPLARRSANPAFEKRGRAFYRDSEVGYLGAAWEIGEVVHQFKKKTDARAELAKKSKYKMGAIVREPAMSLERANSLELTMEPLSVIGIRLDEDGGAIKRGVILFESMEKDKFNSGDREALENAQQTRSLRIVMIAVSELFRSITIAQAAEEAAE